MENDSFTRRNKALTNRDVNSPDPVRRSLMIGGGVAMVTLSATAPWRKQQSKRIRRWRSL
jgi:hypothetical protein